MQVVGMIMLMRESAITMTAVAGATSGDLVDWKMFSTRDVMRKEHDIAECVGGKKTGIGMNVL